MSEKATDVMIAGYLTKDGALLDYDALLKSRTEIDGAVCIIRDLAGNTTVEQTDHLAKGGAKVLGGAGFVIDLVAPAVLAATGVGAAAAVAVGNVGRFKVKGQAEDHA